MDITAASLKEDYGCETYEHVAMMSARMKNIAVTTAITARWTRLER